MLIVFVGFIAYSNSFHASFHMDDEDSIIKNVAIRHLWDIRAIWDFYPSRFLTYFTFAINYAVGGLNVVGYHFFNIFLHLLSGILVYQLALLTISLIPLDDEKLKGRPELMAVFAALIFVSHPLQVGAVTYIVQRAVVMSSFFYLLAMVCYIRGVRDNLRSYRRAALGAAVLSLFSKEMALTLPVALLVYDRTFFREKKGAFLRLMPFFIVMLLMPASLVFSKHFNLKSFELAIDLSSRPAPLNYLLTQFRVFLTYTKLLLFPLHQNFDYDYRLSKTLFEPGVLVGLGMVISLLLSGLILLKKNHPFKGFVLIWFFLLLLPESSIFPIHDLAVEHRLYLVVAAFSLLFATSLFSVLSEKASGYILLFFVSFLFLLTYDRNIVMSDEVSLWTDTIQKSPNSASAYLARGTAYNARGQMDLAIEDFDRCIEIEPHFVRAYNNRGIAYYTKGDFSRALEDYNKLLKLNPKFSSAYLNRGAVYYAQGNVGKAFEDWTKAIELDPLSAENAYSNRAVIFGARGDLQGALHDLNAAVGLNPLNPNWRLARARVHYKMDNKKACLADIQEAEKITRELPEDILAVLKNLR